MCWVALIDAVQTRKFIKKPFGLFFQIRLTIIVEHREHAVLRSNIHDRAPAERLLSSVSVSWRIRFTGKM